jgi:hypothetical protein
MHLDIYKEANNNPAFRNEVVTLANAINNLESQSITNPAMKQETQECIKRLYQLCDYNPGFLVPHFFPAYPYDKPLTLTARPFSYSMLNLQVGGFTVIRASRQIGKSTTLIARQLINAHVLPNYRSLHVVPHEEHRKTYANRLREMERAFAYSVNTKTHRQNLNYKEYPNGSLIELIRVLTTAAESRGKTTDELLYDEYQHFDMDLEAEVSQTQKASSMPVTIYAGTSLTIDTPLEARWMDSSKGTWHIRTGHVNKLGEGIWINTGDKEQVLKIIKAQGPTCPISGKLLNVRDGEFVHEDLNRLRAGYQGLHIPQVIIPDFVESPRKWNEIWLAYTTWPNKNKFLQEIIGIPTEEGHREVSLTDLKAMCNPNETQASRAAKARRGAYRYLVGGCDWGGSDYSVSDRTKLSKTVHVVLGITTDWKVEIVHMRKYDGMDYRNIIVDILATHKDLKCNAMASDFGVGAVYNLALREEIRADAHMIIAYSGPRSAPLGKPVGHGFYNQYSLNRTEAITNLYSVIRSPERKLTCYNYDEAALCLDDFLNMYRIPVENTVTGATEFKYKRHGSKSDDILHAINFAYTLARLYMGEQLVEDRGLTSLIQKSFGFGSGRNSGSGVGVLGQSIPRVVSG